MQGLNSQRNLSSSFVTKSTPSDSFAWVGSNSQYLEELELQWRANPSSVPVEWQTYFASLPEVGSSSATFQSESSGSSSLSSQAGAQGEIISLIRAFQVFGHHVSKLDPLGKYSADLDFQDIPQLHIENYPHLCKMDPNTPITLSQDLIKGFLSSSNPPQNTQWTLKTLLDRLQETYCGTIGYEYMHINNRDVCNWLRERIETATNVDLTENEKKVLYERLTYSHMFEDYLANKFPTTKRFGLEGCESLIPGLKSMIDTSSSLGVDSFVVGMPHRGRLNVLANVMRKPLAQIFREFLGKTENKLGSGDVKYHLGTSTKRHLPFTNKEVELSLVPNPSHLEAVNPVVEGKVKAKQVLMGDNNREKVLPVLLHGDAAFAGQGVIYETMGLSQLDEYGTGGTIHVVVNNQIGFTTNPRSSRSTSYCTDIAKFLNAPVFHVNADDPNAVVKVCKLAAEYRQQYHGDVVIDIVCYRKRGHNELDEPMFTQPLMYQAIAKQEPVISKYRKQLLKEGIVNEEHLKQVDEQVKNVFDVEFARAKTDEKLDVTGEVWYLQGSKWDRMKTPHDYSPIRSTGIPMEVLKTLGKQVSTLPENDNFKPHKGIARVYNQRSQMIESGEGLDWGMGETLAYATLLNEGYHVRISGQDVERGTFSHRHAVVTDQESEKRYIPLKTISNTAQFTVANSSLSEFGVLGFEYGYSMESPNQLVIWEGQFGDFANGASIIVDQFISCAEQKWMRSSGLTLLLPHGYEGQGPEHSNARMERYLQLCDEDDETLPEKDSSKTLQIQKANMQVVNCTTPANFFHVLRRQLHRDFRKPLVVFTPKSLLRLKEAASSLSEFAAGTSFKQVIDDETGAITDPKKVKRVVFCSGKVYYDLLSARTTQNVALVRVEQLAPFPFHRVIEIAEKYPNAEYVWCQEEPKNYGGWSHVYPRFKTCLKNTTEKIKHHDIRFVGRKISASPATGYASKHNEEQREIVTQALN
ncbi:2-oxoglutarate dehydrogenase [Naegleria gruberi]|uniref:2-oxoglutarate dehydrogenase, mitochondrial n=1 Tax=Naegleria gruberi TaxID=5762 RepID=D2V465_NAEGR|nr:2-oxoglutarate dehydrogenase [Naegleria gruberi]EFC48328.1 2-oxoglutarate dehydrogenase [Naegleria gruberi]|eukprot:XP_002681072.1 2-oxoglutarate dehydrogenase [Naegleria gruberi strain NEG-M]